MANENLLFRKGLQSRIKDLPITPGAISITIDEPGMYIDLPANASLGHATDYRVRIGDVITVQTLGELADLKNITPEDLTEDGTTSLKDRISAYSSSALYYVSDKNMLLKYDGSSKFIWINDTSALQNQLATLSQNLTNVTGRVTTLEGTVGSKKTSTSNATGMFAYIDAADKLLQDQIDELTGTSSTGTSLSSLKAALDQEIEDRAAADSALDGKITAVSNKFNNYSTTTQMNSAISTAKSELTTAIGTAKSEAISAAATDAATKVAAEETRALAAEEALRGSIAQVSGSLKDYAKASNVYTKTEIDGKVDDLEDAIDAAKTAANNYTDGKIATVNTAYKNADTQLGEQIAQVSTNITNNYYNKDTIDAKVETIEGNIDAAQSAAEGNAKTYTDAEIKKIETAYKAADTALQTALDQKITTVSNNLANNYYNSTTIDSKVTTINQAIADAQSAATTAGAAAAKTYTDTEIGKIDTAYKAADTVLDGKITQVSNNFSNYYQRSEVYTKTETDGLLDSHLAEAKTYVDNVLGAAEAMIYKGTIAANDGKDSTLQSALAAKTNVEAGHVYVVSSLTETYRPGDLMIAAKDGSGTDKKLSWSTSNWHHVKTGYDVNLEQQLKATIDTSTAKNGGKVELDSIGTTDTGSISFKAASDANGYTSSARVTMALNTSGNTKNSTVTFGMVWTDF